MKRRSKRGRYFYGCSRYPACDMAVWDEPVNEFCSVCGAIKVKKVRKNKEEELICSNPECTTHPKKKTVTKISAAKKKTTTAKKTPAGTAGKTKTGAGD